jgi:hypothetical protein
LLSARLKDKICADDVDTNVDAARLEVCATGARSAGQFIETLVACFGSINVVARYNTSIAEAAHLRYVTGISQTIFSLLKNAPDDSSVPITAPGETA